MRAGALSSTLAAMGHDVIWWTSSFNHSLKLNRATQSVQLILSNRLSLRLLHGISYRNNIGLGRLINHMQLAWEFRRLAPQELQPDVIFCCWPPIELGAAASEYAQRHSIPLVMDVRDLWPDIFVGAVPSLFRPLLKCVLLRYGYMTRSTFQRARSIVGISRAYLDWGLNKANRPRGDNDAVFPLGCAPPTLFQFPIEHGIRDLCALGVDPSKAICWFLGSFGNTYDLEPVICAARRLQEQGDKSTQFVLSGDGPNRKRYWSIAAGLRNVVFTAWLSPELIALMMTIADVAIAAHRKGAPQGLSNKIFEYMSAGLPILSSLEGECRSFLSAHDCGIWYAAGSTESFLEALNSLMDDQARCRQLGLNGMAAFEAQYSSSIIYPKLAVYLERTVLLHRRYHDSSDPQPIESEAIG